MRKAFLPLLVLCMLPAYSAIAAPKLHPCPPGSYLRYRAATVNELVYQVSRDNNVRTRYARHFGVSPTQLTAYLRTLKLTSLKSSRLVQSWYMDKNGRSRVKSKRLPKGELVFVAGDGQPVISWSCGNPIGKPTVTKKAVPKQVAQAPVETQVLPAVPEVITAPVEAVLPAPLEIVEQVAPMVAAAPNAVAAIMESNASGLGALPYLGGLAGLVGGIVALDTSHDEIVPEPSSAVALAVGVFGLGGVVRRRRISI